MSTERSFLSAMVAELNRRKVLKTVGAYAVVVFVLLQLMDAAVEPLLLPDWVPTIVTLILILGFPVVFMLAWLFDVTSGGVQRTGRGELSGKQTAFLVSVMLLVTGGLGYAFYGFYGRAIEAEVAAEELAAEQRSFQAPENSIAVLPFADLSEAGDQAYLGDGIAEEILNLLAQVEGLQVAARTSSFSFRDDERDIRDIGRLLNVSTVLEGSVRTADDRVRLTAQLINVEDGYHIWSKSYDRELDDLFAIQDEVAHSIAESLVDSFTGLESGVGQSADSRVAWDLYQQGRLLWWRRTPEDLQQAILKFGEAIEADPFFAPAHAAMADSYLLLSSYGNITPVEANKKATKRIEHALELDPQSAEAFAALGLARWQIGQMTAAESALRNAIRLNESYVPAQLWLAGLLGEQGRWPEQTLVLGRAMELDPYNELLAVNLATNLSTRGQGDEARDKLASLIAVKPDSAMLLQSIAPIAAEYGALVDAWTYADRAYSLASDSPQVVTAMADMLLQLEEFEQAEAIVREGLEESGDNFGLVGALYRILLVQNRIEEATALVNDHFRPIMADLPPSTRGNIEFQLGLLSLASGDAASAVIAFEKCLALMDEDEAYGGARTAALTLTAAAYQQLGNVEGMETQLEEAERGLQRARLNGVDNPSSYYDEAVIRSLYGDSEGAISALRTAYDNGLRQVWLIRVDWRLDGLRDNPEFLDLQARIEEDVNQAKEEIRGLQLARA